jgi:hypothetical protein
MATGKLDSARICILFLTESPNIPFILLVNAGFAWLCYLLEPAIIQGYITRGQSVFFVPRYVR